MKNTFVLVCAMILMVSCAEKKKLPSKQDNVVEDTLPPMADEDETVVLDKSSFKANGSEPLWGLTLFENRFELDQDEAQTSATLPEPIVVESSNLKMYRVQEGSKAIDIIIAQKECLDTITNKKSPYTVTISYKDTYTGTTTVLEGCGAYVTDYRLHATWELQKINGKPIPKSNFKGMDLPYLELNAKTNRFSGLAGCNRMTGGIIFDDAVLRFSEAAVTRMACPNLDLETKFLSQLATVVSYSIRNDQLHLSDGNGGVVLQFNKADQR